MLAIGNVLLAPGNITGQHDGKADIGFSQIMDGARVIPSPGERRSSEQE